MNIKNLDNIKNELVKKMNAYLGQPRVKRDPQLLVEAATFILDARELHETKDGALDIQGKTHAYRQWMGEVYSLLNLTNSEKEKLGNTLRYHIGNVLRERYSTEILKEQGLHSQSLRERGTHRRERRAETVELFKKGSSFTDQQSYQALKFMLVAMNRFDPSFFSEVTTATFLELKNKINSLNSAKENS